MQSVLVYPSRSKRFVVNETWKVWNRFTVRSSSLNQKCNLKRGHGIRDGLGYRKIRKESRVNEKDLLKGDKMMTVKDVTCNSFGFFSPRDEMGLSVKALKLPFIDYQCDNSMNQILFGSVCPNPKKNSPKITNVIKLRQRKFSV